jgi:NaMN:DMB phosphoribosyltransferase
VVVGGAFAADQAIRFLLSGGQFVLAAASAASTTNPKTNQVIITGRKATRVGQGAEVRSLAFGDPGLSLPRGWTLHRPARGSHA